MPETRRRVLGSWAILALLNDEEGAEQVAARLIDAIESDEPLLVNEINVGEVYYIVARHRSVADAERVVDHLETLPLTRVGNTFDDVLAAARIKAGHRLSYADAFAVATAERLGAAVVTGDPEFRAVEGLVAVEWIGGRPPA